MSAKKMFLGIATGFITGTLAGVMITSKKGLAMRKKILAKGDEFAKEQKKKFTKFLDSIPSQTKKTLKQEKDTPSKTNEQTVEKENVGANAKS